MNPVNVLFFYWTLRCSKKSEESSTAGLMKCDFTEKRGAAKGSLLNCCYDLILCKQKTFIFSSVSVNFRNRTWKTKNKKTKNRCKLQHLTPLIVLRKCAVWNKSDRLSMRWRAARRRMGSAAGSPSAGRGSASSCWKKQPTASGKVIQEAAGRFWPGFACFPAELLSWRPRPRWWNAARRKINEFKQAWSASHHPVSIKPAAGTEVLLLAGRTRMSHWRMLSVIPGRCLDSCHRRISNCLWMSLHRPALMHSFN